jgi:hypothetical protein
MQYRRAPASNYDRNGKLVRSKLPTDAAPPPIFQRTLAWRNKKNAKIRAARQQQAELREQQQEGGGGGGGGGIMSAGMSAGMDFHAQYKEATVGEHIDAFHRYNMLVGEADGGNPLPEAEYRKLEKRCAEAAKDRLFCTWRNVETGMDCVNVGPMTRCFCGHSYRAHAFYRNQSKKVHCRVPGCKCGLFQYVYHRGGRAVKCQCKHDLDKHRDKSNRPIACTHRDGACGCRGFVPTVTCTCEMSASVHETVFERASERAEAGRVTRALWNGMEKDGAGDPPEMVASQSAGRDLPRSHRAMAAGAGGLTSYLSLAPGTERLLVAPDAALPAAALELGGMRRGPGGGQQWQQYALEEQEKRMLREAGEDAVERAMAPGGMLSEVDVSVRGGAERQGQEGAAPASASLQGLSEQDFDSLLFGGGQLKAAHAAPAAAGAVGDAGLSPLSKHLAEHQRREEANRLSLQQQQAMLQQQWEQRHAQQFKQEQHIKARSPHRDRGIATTNKSRLQHSHPQNMAADARRRGGVAADRRAQQQRSQQPQPPRTRQPGHTNTTGGGQPRPARRRPAKRDQGNVPSYMRSTAATRLWKSSTEAEKKKPKSQRTEIY